MKTKNDIDDNDIFNAALAEFCSRSFDDASLNTIIKNAHISKGSFYYRFKNKYDLYISVLKTCLKQKWEYIKKEITENQGDEPPKDIFGLFAIQAKIGMNFAQKYPHYHTLSIMFAKEKGTKIFEDALKDLGEHDDSGLNDMIDKAMINNEFNKRFSKNFIQKLITHLFSSFYDIFFKNEKVDSETAYAYLEDYLEFMRNGFNVHVLSE